MVNFNLSKPSYLAAASLFAGKEERRPHVRGVRIEKAKTEGVYIVATDGHRLIAFLDRDGHTDENYTVSVSKELAKAARFHHHRSLDTRLEVKDRILNVFDGKNATPCYMESITLIGEKYPDWRRVVPTIFEPKGGTAFEAKYLGDFAKISTFAFGTKASTSIRIMGNDVDVPSIITGNNPDWFGVLMPIRTSASSSIPFKI